jgi:transposase-like protein
MSKMKLDFCAACGSMEDLHFHHIIPVVITGEKRSVSDENDMITLCSYHHEMIHGIQSSRQSYHNTLVRKGIQKARENGVVLGRPSQMTDEKIQQVAEMIKNGVGVRALCRKLGISTASYYRVVREEIPRIERQKQEELSKMNRILEKFLNPQSPAEKIKI